MTGVATDQPTDLSEYIRITNRRIIALERALSMVGWVNLSNYLSAGTGIDLDGSGTLESPFTVSYDAMQVTDWDDAMAPGTYWADETAVNGPVAGYPYVGTVRVVEGEGTYAGRILQDLAAPTTGSSSSMRLGRYLRLFVNGAWQPWRQAESLSGVAVVTTSSGAIYKDTAVTFPTPNFFINSPAVVIGNQVNATANSLVSQAINVTTSGFTMRTATTQATAWTATYNLFWIALEQSP